MNQARLELTPAQQDPLLKGRTHCLCIRAYTTFSLDHKSHVLFARDVQDEMESYHTAATYRLVMQIYIDGTSETVTARHGLSRSWSSFYLDCCWETPGTWTYS